MGGETLATIYFGGGTPSLLKIEDCQAILNKLRQNFPITNDAEITLEANPDDINHEKLLGWRDAGINRLSIGIQSFFEEDLKWMNRAHNAQQSFACIGASLNAGFSNMSIDLIYGSPLLTDEMWQQNVETAVRYGIPHLSCYALTVEEKTPLHKQILTKRKDDVDNEKQARQFLLLMEWLRKNGYEHYEVSNFAKPGFRSRHNSSYWRGEKYLGLGPSAHSYDGIKRQWNVANNNQYIQAIGKAEIDKETEVLTEVQQLNEYIMISLRTMEGIDLKKLEHNWGVNRKARIEKSLLRFKENGLLQTEDNYVRLTDDGMLRADGIAADLFF